MKGKDIVKDAIGVLLNPISPVVTLLVGGLVSSFINSTPIPVNIVIYLLSMWIVITVAYQIHISEKEKHKDELEKLNYKLSEKDAIIKAKDQQISSQIGLIEAKYGEFSVFLKSEQYKTILKKIINAFSYVEAIYTHSYYMYVRDDKVVIKIDYENGYHNENLNVNTIMQQYFYIEKSVYSKYRNLWKDYSKLNVESEDHIRVFEANALNLIKLLLNNATSENKRIVSLIMDMLFNIFGKDYPLGNLIIKEKKFRTGILGTILSNEGYLYDYEKEDIKKANRSYFSFNDIIDGEYKVATVVINSNSIEDINKDLLISDVISYYDEEYNKIFKSRKI